MPGNLQRATLWLLDQTHIVVTGITALTFLKTRSAHVGYFIAGAVLFNTFAKLSKNVIRQDRPTVNIEDDPQDSSSRRPKKKVKKTYGMPSTHSTSIGFYMAYLVLSLPPFNASPVAANKRDTQGLFQGFSGGLMALGTVVWGTSIMWSRVRIGYHTLAQVLVGAALGLSGGVMWRMLWDDKAIGSGWERILQHWVDRAFGVAGMY